MKLKQGLFFLLALAVFMPLANSQTTCDLIPGPCAERAWRRAYAPVDRMLGQLDQQDQNYGGYYPGGAYIGGVGVGGGNRTATVIGLAAAGAGIGYAFGGRNGAIIGAGAGTIGGIIATRGGSGYSGSKPVDCSKKKLNKKEQAICEQALAEQQAAEQQRQVNAELAERQRTGKRLQNKTGFPVEVCDCGQIVGMLRSGQTMSALESRCGGYTAQMLVPDPTAPGVTVRREAEFHVAPDMSGWVFVAPRIQGGGR